METAQQSAPKARLLETAVSALSLIKLKLNKM